ncbi:hypothetical protein T4D_14414 [Trichinella pseudospiralis]|uniref:Uncharacterized protein n=1 Tax=Trichinella pseudospiralis TaxID=6337 RepID=A0A0V1FY38_TRIPS|nr:hypothetical protein T4D_14414 [Trichinella pseudospiralis]
MLHCFFFSLTTAIKTATQISSVNYFKPKKQLFQMILLACVENDAPTADLRFIAKVANQNYVNILDAKTESMILLGVFCEWMRDFMEERNCQDPLSLNSCEQWTDGRSDGER